MDTNYRIAWLKAMEELRERDYTKIAAHSGVAYDGAKKHLLIPFFRQPYVIDCSTWQLYHRDTGKEPPVGAGIMILHYLLHAQDIPLSGRLISLKEVPNGGMLFYPAFQKEAIFTCVETFSRDFAGFYQAAEKFGGESTKRGDAAVCLPAFPKVPVTLILWAGDEEVPASGTILFDASVDAFLPVEDIIGLGSYCVHVLVKAYQDPCRKGAMW